MIKRVAGLVPPFLLLIAVLIRIFGDIESLPDAPFFDDSFYAFSVSKNLAAGHGLSIDGVHATNGFQPLWVVAIAPIWWLSSDPYVPLRIVYALSFLCLIGCWWQGRHLLRDLGVDDDASRLTLIGLLFLSYTAFRHVFNGLETGLVVLVMLALFRGVLAYERKPDLIRSLLVGLLMGLAVLTRIDCGFYVLGGALSMALWGLARKTSRAELFGHLAAAGVTAFLVSVPWWGYNLLVFGHLIPSSGTAQMSGAMGQIVDLWRNAGEMLLAILVNFAHIYFLSFNQFPIIPALSFVLRTLLFAAVLLAILLVLWRLGAFSLSSRARTLLFPFLGALSLLMLIYATRFWVFHMFIRYAIGWFVASLVVLPLFASSLSRKGGRGARLLAAAGFALGTINAVLIAATILGLGIGGNTQYHEQMPLIESGVQKASAVAAGQSGTLGYFRDRVVNLDGKVNPEVKAAKDKGISVTAYLTRQNVCYFADWESYFGNVFPSEERANWQKRGQKGAFALYENIRCK